LQGSKYRANAPKEKAAKFAAIVGLDVIPWRIEDANPEISEIFGFGPGGLLRKCHQT
jgi:hypothetical protein